MASVHPACAGNTAPCRNALFSPAVHPRVCGEHWAAERRIISRPGSSPRVRGTLIIISRNIANERFIPACAGNTTRTGRVRTIATVHPRVCGEHAHLVGALILCLGSSPRVRGTQ